MLRWILIIVGVLALAAAIYLTGVMLPHHHVARVEGLVAKPVADVAAQIRAVEEHPQWRRGVVIENVERTEDAVSYVELNDGERISYRLTEPEQGRKFVATITDPALPFGGAWTFTLTPEGENVRVSIEEDGEIRDPIYRVFAHFVFGYTSNMEGYLRALGAEDVVVVAKP